LSKCAVGRPEYKEGGVVILSRISSKAKLIFVLCLSVCVTGEMKGL